MKSNLTFDFNVNKAEKSILIKREFAAELSLVWDAYTKSELLDLWWAPKPWKARTKSMDFRVGGSWHYAMVGPEGEEHWALANYIEIEQLKRFTGLDAFTDIDGNVSQEMPQSKWEVNFSENNGNTIVNFEIRFDDLAQLEATIEMGFKEGMTIAMEGLDELLTTLKK